MSCVKVYVTPGNRVLPEGEIDLAPALDTAAPERAWEWLTSEPQVIEFIKFWFRNFGIWVLALAVFVLVPSATGFRHGQHRAWYSLLDLPVHIIIHMFIWPWTIPFLGILMIVTLLGLLLPVRVFFPKDVV